MRYTAMRERWCRAALAAFLRRWGAYIVIAAVLFGAGSNSPAHAVAGVGAVTVLPVVWAAERGVPWWLPAFSAQALLVATLLWACRGLLWPRAWAAIERALPIDPREQRRSDWRVLAVAALPLVLLQAVGLVSVATGGPGVVAGAVRTVTALGLWASGTVVGMAFAARGLGRLRAPLTSRLTIPRALFSRGDGWAKYPSVALVLLPLPLLRGPAQAAGRLMVAFTAACVAAAGSAAFMPQHLAWVLAALAVLALLGTWRLATRLRDDLAALHAAAEMLPIAPPRLRRAQLGAALVPLAVASVGLLGAFLFVPDLARLPWRPWVLGAFVVVLWANCGTCAWAVTRPPPRPGDTPSAGDSAGWWLFALVLCLALASQVQGQGQVQGQVLP
jgi:hypothetical protein